MELRLESSSLPPSSKATSRRHCRRSRQHSNSRTERPRADFFSTFLCSVPKKLGSVGHALPTLRGGNYDQTTTCTPLVYCKDNKLVALQRLKRDEYICHYGLDGNELLTNSYQFGMNNHKRLVLAAQDDVIWSAKKGDFLNMQKDGNAVVYKDGMAQWSTGCRKHGNFLQIESQGVFMRNMGDDGRHWFVGP